MYIPKKTIQTVLERSQGFCELCGRNNHLQMAHIVGKGMGGRHGKAKEHNDRPENILHLCDMCHNAVSHGITVIRDAQSCATCWLRGIPCKTKAHQLGIVDPKSVFCV